MPDAHVKIHIIFFNDLGTQQEAFWNDLCRFLGLDSTPKIDFKILNTTHGGYKFKILNKILNSKTLRNKNTVNKLLSFFPSGATYKLIHKMYFLLTDMNKKPMEHKPMSDKVIDILIDIYKKDVESLSVLVNRNLAEQWFAKIK